VQESILGVRGRPDPRLAQSVSPVLNGNIVDVTQPSSKIDKKVFEKPLSEQELPADTLSDRCLKHGSEGICGMANQVYSSDLNDAEWALLAPLVSPAKSHGRPRRSRCGAS